MKRMNGNKICSFFSYIYSKPNSFQNGIAKSIVYTILINILVEQNVINSFILTTPKENINR